MGTDQGLGEEGGEVCHYLPEVQVDVVYHEFIRGFETSINEPYFAVFGPA